MEPVRFEVDEDSELLFKVKSADVRQIEITKEIVSKKSLRALEARQAEGKRLPYAAEALAA